MRFELQVSRAPSSARGASSSKVKQWLQETVLFVAANSV